jgi:hypothetical protein
VKPAASMEMTVEPLSSAALIVHLPLPVSTVETRPPPEALSERLLISGRVVINRLRQRGARTLNRPASATTGQLWTTR